MWTEVRTSDLPKEFLILVLKVGCEDSFSNVVENFLSGPEASPAELIFAWLDGAVVDAPVDIDELALPLALEDIVAERFGLEVGDAKLLANLTVQGLIDILAQVNMSTYSRVPLVWLNVFPCRTMLKIQLALAVKDVQVDDGMKNLTAVVRVSTTDGAKNVPVFIHYRELLIGIVSHNIIIYVIRQGMAPAR